MTPNGVIEKERAPRKRGAPLPEDWRPDDDTIQWAKTNHPTVNLKNAHEKFANYWRAIPGQKGLKLDWTATWRNWIIREAEQHTSRNGNGNGVRKLTHREQGWLQAELMKSNPDPAVLAQFGHTKALENGT